MHVVAAVIDQGALTFDLAIPCEVFGTDRRDIVDPWYEMLVVAARSTPVRTQAGFWIDTPYGLDDLARAETIVVPGWSDPDDAPSEALLAALREAHARGARIVSLCTGVFVLAAAGLLDGRRATTHWLFTDRLRERYPAIDVDPAVLYVAEGNVMTSAGTAAGLDLCLHLVALDHGVDVAIRVARRIVVPAFRAGGQAQYVEHPIDREPVESPFGDLLEWARERIASGVTVDDLARRAAVSPRTLARRFRAAVGLPPGAWLRRERMLLAQRLLETRHDPLTEIASKAGYASATTMRAEFASRLGTSPRAYRQGFRRPA